MEVKLDYRSKKGFSDELRDMKELFDAYRVSRRYQGMLEGKTPWEETVWMWLAKIYFHAIVNWRRIAKRAVDLSVALIGLVLSAPLFAIISLAIKLDSKGTAIYSQRRVGIKGKHFFMLKFRTMRSDAEQTTGPMWAQENDPRVTRVGNFLRKTHLDELPQLINVLKGEMSLVGPRPERPHFVNELRREIQHYDRRLCVKPGITGLAQVRQGYDTSIRDVQKKLRYDTLYIRKMCPVFDIKIVAMTVLSVVLRTGR